MKKMFGIMFVSFIVLACANVETTQAAEIQMKTYNPQRDFGGGCCSHHGGECGCSLHHVQCCDGWNGSSCGC